MKADGDILGTLAIQFAIMSLLALGGANAVVPEMHRQAVELRGWMSDREFTDMFAMSQAAPGPGSPPHSSHARPRFPVPRPARGSNSK